jgi:hypothetical protein
MSALESRPEWVKTSLSFLTGDCVEVAGLPSGEVGVRNSRDAAGAVLCFTPEEWDAFLGGVRNGEFDRFGPQSGTSGVLRGCIAGDWPADARRRARPASSR